MKPLSWVLMLSLVMAVGCKFTLKLPQAIEYADASFETLTFTPSVLPNQPPRLVVVTSRYQPVDSAIDPIRVDDISAQLVVARLFGDDERIPVELTQEAEGAFLNEQGSNELTARLTAELPAGVGPKSVRAVEITFRGQIHLAELKQN
jgi:hypothetical protein